VALTSHPVSSSADAVVALRNVSHSFTQGTVSRQILFDLNADIWPGELVIVMGPSGSGKTTMLNLIGALRNVMKGSLCVVGSELRDASITTRTQIRRQIGFIFQQHHLLESLTVRQNVQMGIGTAGFSAREVRRRAEGILDQVGLADYLGAYPASLSGGQRQRVAVARALVRQPRLLLADEPTSALDRQTGREVVELLRTLARREGCAVLMVTHDNRVLEVADRLMYLEDGRLSSFAPVTSQHAAHLLTALRPLVEQRAVGSLVNRMQDAEFLDLLRTLAAESEQFLNVLDFGDPSAAHEVFAETARAVVAYIVSHLGASEGLVWLHNESGGVRLLIGSPPQAEDASPAVLDCLHTGCVRQQQGLLYLPLAGRDMKTIGVAEMRAEVLNESAVHLFRDFARPLGLLAEVCGRLERCA
jgi:putative ABC transport system ATP-binding protein